MERKENEEQELDRDLAVEVAAGIIFSDEGLGMFQQSLEGNDPVAMIAKTVVMALAKVRQEFGANDLPLDDTVFLGEDGAGAELIIALIRYCNQELGMELDEQQAFQMAMEIAGQDAQELLRREQEGEPRTNVGPPPPGGSMMPKQGLAERMGGRV